MIAIGELPRQVRRGQDVALAAHDERGRRDLAEPVQRVVRDARLRLAHEDAVVHRGVVAQVEAPHRVDQVLLLQGRVAERPDRAAS